MNAPSAQRSMTTPSERLRQLVAGRRVLLTASAAASPILPDQLRKAGAPDVRRVGLDPGPVPEGDWASAVRADRLLHNPSRHLIAALSRDDPDGTAVVIAGSRATTASVAGRPVLGHRRPAWADLEHRDVQAALTRSGETILQLADARSLLQSRAFAHQTAVVLRGLPRTSPSLGSTHNFLLLTNDDPATALHDLAGDCDRVAVAPFAHGLPVTVYGFVAGRTVVTQLPVVALLFRDRSGRLHAPGILLDSALSPAEIATIETETAAVIINAVSQSGYRGAFGVDGTLVGDQFLIHDFNARVCAGFRAMDSERLGIHPSLLDVVLRECDDAEELLVDLGRRPIAHETQRAVLWEPSDETFSWIADIPPSDAGREAQTAWLARVASQYAMTWAGKVGT